ncbi:hypothetical protein THRCLA_21742 [Thraustotheca clavata]|uniref:Uncharacterized protein n=1 Tax=Thraustotheca clavata TaxID=74557 RepID=A0A1V9ZQ41_9STRA|nr:hypothetical protein THRCLA_21742 [Thraustotheca clavata]
MSWTHSTLAMALMELSRDRRYDENEQKNGPERHACMALIRLNLLRRRDKLTMERKERNQSLSQFPDSTTSLLQLPTITQCKTEISMQVILSSMERKRSYTTVYPSEIDIIANESDIANGLVCRYSTGKCQHRRAQKNDGTYLNLCHMHRIRANANQRKLDRKKSKKHNQRQQLNANGMESRKPGKVRNILQSILQTKKPHST